ncbi:bifunctional YncE family protein/alkaline phosphatase family protein [Acidiferrimicrobium sp. IK]|uniref:bifunctional YncE family protein/alkaline phosphatase family protein n=1 Tax=Acidiferrimicrobium sp. IK TaxID=2871700 RepID=UPI0021CB3BFC|nr:bifunctional YncE family protein/alkaline phosphatase family protein [Acidiferrimicrobium sp. IK]MCU4185288.1 bifunctional YncE family protein/alkaline phosphatase family protein [Acidiferrimicrobium sp. IK]
MKRLRSKRWRHDHRRALRRVSASTAAVALIAGGGTAAAAAITGGGFGDSQVGTSNANGILLATQQRIKPAGTRVLDTAGRILSSTISPDGRYLAALSWKSFNGFLTIFDLKTGTIVQTVGTGSTADPTLGDGNVAADGPLYSADGTSLWFPQGADLIHFSVQTNGTVDSASKVVIPLTQTIVNLTTGNTTTDDLPSGMALSADGKSLYVAFNGTNQLGVIDTATNQVRQVIAVGNAPRQVTVVGHTAFVTNEGGRPAKPGDFTNQSDGTAVVASKVTGAATTGTVSVVDLRTGKETSEIPVGLQPTAEYLAPGGILMVANSNDDTFSMINTATRQVVQTVNVNPLPGSTVGSYPNAITMPDAHHILVSIGRDNALAEYAYGGPRQPVQYMGLIPTDFYPVGAAYDPAIGKIVVTNDKGIGSLGPESTINKGPGDAPAPNSVTGHNTYDDTSSLTEFALPSSPQLALYTDQVFKDNNWDHLLASQPVGNRMAAPVAIPAALGSPSKIKHVFLIVRENRTYDQVLGDIGKGNSDPALAQFGTTITPNAHALANQFSVFDNFYDEGTLSADGHNWLMQADANDYIEKEFGAFYRSYPAQGGDALAYQRNGFIWNAAEKAGQTVKAYGEYNNFVNISQANPTWSQFYQDSQILEGKAKGPLPIPESAVKTYADIPSLNAIDDPQFPPFMLQIPDQYRADVWQQSFTQQVKTDTVPNLSMIWMPDDHTSGPGQGTPQPTAEVADNDLAVGRIIQSISHSPEWKDSAVFVVEDDSQNGTDHVDGHRSPLLVASPYANRDAVNSTYYTQLNVVRTIEQILGIAPMNQEDRAAEPMFDAFTNKADLRPYTAQANQVPLTLGLSPAPSRVSAAAVPAGSTSAPSTAKPSNATPAAAGVPASEAGVYQQWVEWARNNHFGVTNAIPDFANAAQLNHYDWYSAHNWTTPYPGEKTIVGPNQVPGHQLPGGYLGD